MSLEDNPEIQKIKEDKKKEDKATKEDFVTQIATREMLERDAQEDTMLVTFEVKPDVKRTIEAKQPNFEELKELLRFGSKLLQSDVSPENIPNQYDDLPRLAAAYSSDEEMDEDWWKTKMKFRAMANFVFAVMTKAQTGQSDIPEDQLEYFRQQQLRKT